MASTYYDSSGKEVADGEIAYASDLNDINTSVDTAFQQVELDIDTISTNQSYYSDLAEKWATEAEDTEVETGKYSALHYAAKAADEATDAAADAVQTAADRVQTGVDKAATAADRVQTGLDRTQTGLDKVATAADRVQTGLDVIAAAASASDASDSAIASAAAAAAISDSAYSSSWNGVANVAPSQNALYDKIEALATSIAAFVSVPVSTVIAVATSTVPTGYLECNGAAVSRSTYSSLFTAISDDYGAGDGSTTFNLPDYRGEFLRGWAHGTTNDPDKATRTDRGDGTTGDYVGTKQADGLESHTHTIAVYTNNNYAGSGSQNGTIPGSATTTSSTGGNETRPRNVNVMYCIKY